DTRCGRRLGRADDVPGPSVRLHQVLTEGSPDLALEVLPEPPEVAPGLADLAGHLRQLVGPEHDQGDRQDDQDLRRAETDHEKSLLAARTPRRAAAGAPARSAQNPLTMEPWARSPAFPSASPTGVPG